jgi:hypothetical protein
MVLLSTAYLAPIEYFALLYQQDCWVDVEEHYLKQSYRNRCVIASAQGPISLTIPVIKKNGNHTKVKDILISYSENWQQHHWRTIVSAYNQSPYFLYYQDELLPFYEKKYEYLAEFNLELTQLLLNLLEIETTIQKTSSFISSEQKGITDLRNRIHPKKESRIKFENYIQVFSDRHEFIPNLSILDLLLNLGPESSSYLKQITL